MNFKFIEIFLSYSVDQTDQTIEVYIPRWLRVHIKVMESEMFGDVLCRYKL